MFGRIRRMIAPGPARFSPPKPDAPFYAVGDIHGRADLLEQLLTWLDPSHPVVFVGDYLDRGEHSAAVLQRLRDLSDDPGRSVHCLMGNHEDMLLAFLDDPENRGKSWLRNGGLQTLASYKVAGAQQAATGQELSLVAGNLRAAMGPDLIGWLKRRPLFWRSGNVAVVHAGADPGEPIENQKARTLIWGHPKFLSTPRSDGVWVVHGHTIVDQAICDNGIISVDTGAYATGRLTAAGIGNGSVEFFAP